MNTAACVKYDKLECGLIIPNLTIRPSGALPTVAMSLSDSLIRKTTSRIKQRVASCHTAKVIHCVSKNVPPVTCYNLDIHDPTAIIFGRSVTDKEKNQTMLCFPTSPI